MRKSPEIDAKTLHFFWERGFATSQKKLSKMFQSHTIGVEGVKYATKMSGPVRSEDAADIIAELQNTFELLADDRVHVYSPTLRAQQEQFTSGVHSTCDMLLSSKDDPVEMQKILKLATVRILDESSGEWRDSSPGIRSAFREFRQSVLESMGIERQPWHHAVKDPFGNSGCYDFAIAGGEQSLHSAASSLFCRMGEIAATFVNDIAILDLEFGQGPGLMVQAFVHENAVRCLALQAKEEAALKEQQELAKKREQEKARVLSPQNTDFVDISSLDVKTLKALRATLTAQQIATKSNLSLSEVDSVFEKNKVSLPRRIHSMPQRKERAQTISI